jgi:hypothetical protein
VVNSQHRHKHKHHRRPRSRGGGSEQRNISRVHRDAHVCWHYLFRNYEPHTIAEIINDVWLDPDYMLVVVRRG